MNRDLKKLIQYATNEDWEAMDALIPEVCNQPEVIEWSLKEGVKDPDGNLRDLAVSLLEKSTYTLRDEEIEVLERSLQTDKNIYVQFRAAFTLFNRGSRTKEVMEKMQEALEDPDVKDIAEKYLGKNI